MDTTIVGTGRNANDSLLFHSETLNEGLPVFMLKEKLHEGAGYSYNEVRVHLTELSDNQLNAFIMSAEDLVEDAHELLSDRLMEKQREEDEIEDEIAKKEAMVENPPEGVRYTH